MTTKTWKPCQKKETLKDCQKPNKTGKIAKNLEKLPKTFNVD